MNKIPECSRTWFCFLVVRFIVSPFGDVLVLEMEETCFLFCNYAYISLQDV